MTKEQLNKLREVCRLRTEGGWVREDVEICLDDGGRAIGSMEYGSDCDFVIAADKHMEELIDEVVRLRAIAHTLGLIQGMKREELIAILDGEE